MSFALKPFVKIFIGIPIDNTAPSMVIYNQMDDVQTLLADLKAKGWTNTSIADKIGVTVNAVEKWQSNNRNISKRSLILLNQLTKRKRIPPKRRYAKGSRKSSSGKEH